MSPEIDILVPTYNNVALLGQMLNSLLENTEGAGVHAEDGDPVFDVLVLNNGHAGAVDKGLSSHPRVRVIDMGENKGWEGALKEGVAATKAPYILFANDDLHFVPGHGSWLLNMKRIMDRDAKVAAVGPVSNFVMGYQHMHAMISPGTYNTNLLIGFCVLIRRSALERVGGVHPGLPGGDDFDLSIRFRKEGYALVLDASTFVFHHGCQTGARLHPTYWNSGEMIHDTRQALILKHSLADYLSCTQFTLTKR